MEEVLGRLIKRQYYLVGQLHNSEGPALLYFNNKLEVIEKYYYKNGNRHSKEEWFESLTEDEKIQALFNVGEWK